MPTAEEVASFVAERSAADPKVRRIVEDVKLFDGLTEHAGWRRLADKIRASKGLFVERLASRQMAGEVVPQREIDYYRGFYMGAEYVVGIPEQAETSLEAAAREAWRLTQLELAQRAEESSPYLDPTGGE